MLVMTYSDARANFSTLLNKVKVEGAAIIKRADGTSFRITNEISEEGISPFEKIKPVANLSSGEIIDIINCIFINIDILYIFIIFIINEIIIICYKFFI